MDLELQATCSALGYLEGTTYVKEPDCLETVKDLIRFLRRDTDTCDIRRQLGHAKIIQNDLIPLFKGYHQDKALFDCVIKLLVNLTQPVTAVFNNQIPDEKTLRNHCLEIETHLQDAKEAFVDDELFGVLTDIIKDILKLDWESRREEDYLQLERLFILVRNVLMIPPDPDRELRTDDDATIHDQILWASHTSGLEDLILYIASSDRERTRLCMHVMEIISLMFKEHEVETLAFAGVQRSMTEKEKDQRELEKAREKEQTSKKASILKYSARHSRFGGTFIMNDMKSITESNVIYHKPLCEVDRFSYDDEKVPKKKSKNLAPVRIYNNKRRSTLSMRLSLKEFCVQFLMNAYNPLMRAVKDALTRSKSEDNDETYYLWAMRYFMEFCRLHCKRVDLVSETMSMAAFHYIYVQLCTYYENVALGKSEEARVWGRRSHVALKAYQELLKTLDVMVKSKDLRIQESAKVIQSNVFYMMEYRDIFVTLLKKFKESKSSRSYLRDLVESTHIFLKMLENFSKSSRNLMVQKKGKRKSKKTKRSTNSQDIPPLSEEELTTMWMDNVSEGLRTLFQNTDDIPTGLTPFDAASDVSDDQQRIEAMLRIQSCLRDRNLGEAIAVLRAAREVWPEGDGFGSDSGLTDDELETMRVIFMADLPRPESQATEEENQIEEELNEELDDEMEDVRRDEQSFDFKVFISDFAHPYIIKAYTTLLNEFTENSDAVNHCLVKLLHRIGHDLGYVGMMFQASVFNTFSKLFFGPLAKVDRYKELRTFAGWVICQFTQVATINNKVFVDFLFWKSKTEALAVTGDYDFRPKSKAKVTWSEHDADELACLYEKYKDMTHPEMDTVELMMKDMTSDHSRLQVLRELKNQGLITSSKDVKKRKNQWSEEQVQELRDVFEIHKDSQHPSAVITEHLSFEKSRHSVIKKILELGLVQDKKELQKKRRGRTKSEGGKNRKRGDSSEDDDDGSGDNSSNDESSDEGERLFPDTSKRDRRNKKSKDDDSDDDDDGDYKEGDSDDDDIDEEVLLLVRQSASSIGDYIMRLVENGYKDQITWIQNCLRNVAEDREEGMCIPTPLVPLTEENETAMEDEIFLIFLRSIGITPPASEQEMFWRIPKDYNSSDLKVIADSLNHDASGVAAGVQLAQDVVSKVFPNGIGSSSSSREKNMEKKKKDRKEKKKKKEKEKKKKEEMVDKTTNKKAKKRQKKSNQQNVDDSGDNADLPNEGDVMFEDRDDRFNDDGGDDDDDDNAIFGTNRLLDNSDSPVDKLVVRGGKNEDTSDSGLDPEVEAAEQEEIRRQKEKNKNDEMKSKSMSRRKLITEEKKIDLLKRIQEKKNKRKIRGGLASQRGTTQEKAASSDEDNKSSNRGHVKSPGSQIKIKKGRAVKSKGKRIKLLDSDSDSDIDLNLTTSPQSDRIEPSTIVDEEPDMDGITSITKSKKRMLQSDSESGEEMEDSIARQGDNADSQSPKRKEDKETKRLKMIVSDDENDSDKELESSIAKDVVTDLGDEKQGDSDKENDGNQISLNDENGEKSPNTLDDSLHLRFDDSSDEEGDDDGDNVTKSGDHEVVTNIEEKETGHTRKVEDSFPATMLSQTLASDDEDDHIPLRTVLKRKKAVIDDDDDDE